MSPDPARACNPLTGCFLTGSPDGSPTQGFNPCYSAGNNPTAHTDPSGYDPLEGTGYICTSVAAAV